MKIAVLGNDDFVTGFRLSGVKNVFAVEGKELNEKVEEIIGEQKIGILVMDEEEFGSLTHAVKKKLDKVVTPVVVTLSSAGKESNLREMVKKSIGVDLWK